MEPEKFYDLVNKEISQDAERWEATTEIEDVVHTELKLRSVGLDSSFADDPDAHELLDKGFCNQYTPNYFPPYISPSEQDRMRCGKLR